MGLRPQEFWEMRPANYWPILQAANKEKLERCKWEADLIRSLAGTVVNLISSKKVHKLKELWKYPWDSDDTPGFDVNSMSKENRAKQVAELLKKVNNGNSKNKG